MRRMVDLPQPDGPTSAVVRPGAKVMSSGATAATPPGKVLASAVQTISGGGVERLIASGAMDLFEDRTVPEIGGDGAAEQGQRLDVRRDGLVGPPAETEFIGQVGEHQRHLPFGLHQLGGLVETGVGMHLERQRDGGGEVLAVGLPAAHFART